MSKRQERQSAGNSRMTHTKWNTLKETKDTRVTGTDASQRQRTQHDGTGLEVVKTARRQGVQSNRKVGWTTRHEEGKTLKSGRKSEEGFSES